MINDVDITNVTRILERNDYSIDPSDSSALVIRKGKINAKYILISLILPTLLCLIGVFDLTTGDGYLGYIFILVAIVSASAIIQKATRKYKSKLILEDTRLIINDKTQTEEITADRIKRFDSSENAGEVLLYVDHKDAPLLLFQFVNLEDKYLQDDLKKVVAFLSAKYLVDS